MAKEVIGEPSNFPEGQLKGLTAGGKNLVVARIEGKVYAMDGSCSHMRFDLSKGRLDGPLITCRLHGAQFDIRTGERVRNAAAHDMASYPVKEEDGKVIVELP